MGATAGDVIRRDFELQSIYQSSRRKATGYDRVKIGYQDCLWRHGASLRAMRSPKMLLWLQPCLANDLQVTLLDNGPLTALQRCCVFRSAVCRSTASGTFRKYAYVEPRSVRSLTISIPSFLPRAWLRHEFTAQGRHKAPQGRRPGDTLQVHQRIQA